MKISIFGTSRSGKDYTIDGAIKILGKRGMNMVHVSPINMVHRELNGRKLKTLNDTEKNAVMEKIRHNIDEICAVSDTIVDEHYSFPSEYGGKIVENGYSDEKLPFIPVYDKRSDMMFEVVFRDEYLKCTDAVFYLDTPSDVLLSRFRTSDGEKRNTSVTYDDIKAWKNFEKTNLKIICSEKKIGFSLIACDPDDYPEKLAELIKTLN